MTTMPVQRGFIVTSGLGARWGTTHWGTDYGLAGGSGGKPIFAIKDGTAVQVGPASGFGQWIRLDHDARVGGGESVYGHIIPEIGAGQFVREGQRIGRINPDSSTNGGVAPHLHIEFYARSWVGAGQRVVGQTILDPEVVLRGAAWPGESKEEKVDGPIYGIDVASYQAGIDMGAVAREGFAFAIVKQSEGTDYLNPERNAQLDGAIGAGLVTAQYHFMHDVDPQAQVDFILRTHRRDLPVALDWEKYGSAGAEKIASWDKVLAVRDVLRGHFPSVGLYLNKPDHEQHSGSASLGDWDWIWKAAYPYSYVDYASSLYNRAPDWGWGALGGRVPEIWQFASTAKVANMQNGIDANAFRGTADELRALFNKTPIKKEGFLMALNDAEQKELLDKTRAIHHELTHRFDSRYDLDALSRGEITPDQVHKETLIGYVLDNDRKIEDIHANMLPTVGRAMIDFFTGKKEKK